MHALAAILEKQSLHTFFEHLSQPKTGLLFKLESIIMHYDCVHVLVVCSVHCKNSSVTMQHTKFALYSHLFPFGHGVPMEQIRCAGHTTVFTVYV